MRSRSAPDVPVLGLIGRHPRPRASAAARLQARSASRRSPALRTRQSMPSARLAPSLPEQSCRLRRSRTRSPIPKTRLFLHNGPWSSLNEAWSRQPLTPLFRHHQFEGHFHTRHASTYRECPLPHLRVRCRAMMLEPARRSNWQFCDDLRSYTTPRGPP